MAAVAISIIWVAAILVFAGWLFKERKGKELRKTRFDLLDAQDTIRRLNREVNLQLTAGHPDLFILQNTIQEYYETAHRKEIQK